MKAHTCFGSALEPARSMEFKTRISHKKSSRDRSPTSRRQKFAFFISAPTSVKDRKSNIVFQLKVSPPHPKCPILGHPEKLCVSSPWKECKNKTRKHTQTHTHVIFQGNVGVKQGGPKCAILDHEVLNFLFLSCFCIQAQYRDSRHRNE